MFNIELKIQQGSTVKTIIREVNATELRALRNIHGEANITMLIPETVKFTEHHNNDNNLILH